MNDTLEVRSFLSALSGGSARCRRLPPELLRLATHAAHGDHEDAQDLVGDVLLDLLERNGQAGSIDRILELKDQDLWGALRTRMAQVRATQFGSKSRLVKTLRSHVATALEAELRPPEALPLSLMAGDRLCARLVREAVAWLLGRAEALPRDPKVLATELLGMYFAARPGEVSVEVQGQVDVGHEEQVIHHLDAGWHADRLRHRLGSDLACLVDLRIKGRTLKEIASGRVAVSTVHEQLGKAVDRIREHAQQNGLSIDDVGLALRALAA